MALRIKNLKKSFHGLTIFENFDIEINEKEINCILGPSGVGKTTLLNILSGIIDADKGQLSDLKEKTISYIFQEPRLLAWKTVYGNISFVLKNLYNRQEIENITNKYISIVGLKNFKDYYPDKLSGGMKQRVSIARAFAYPSDILIMDEPFKSLDFKLKKSLIVSFVKLWEIDKRTVMFVTHDVEEAALLGNVIYILKDSQPTEIEKVVHINARQIDRILNPQKTAKTKKTLLKYLK